MADIIETKDLNVKDTSKLKTGDLRRLKSKTELYLYEVEKCMKAGGKNMECKLQVRDEMDRKSREKKAKEAKKAKKK